MTPAFLQHGIKTRKETGYVQRIQACGEGYLYNSLLLGKLTHSSKPELIPCEGSVPMTLLPSTKLCLLKVPTPQHHHTGDHASSTGTLGAQTISNPLQMMIMTIYLPHTRHCPKHFSVIQSLRQSFEVGALTIVPSLQMRKIRHRKVCPRSAPESVRARVWSKWSRLTAPSQLPTQVGNYLV